MGIDYEAVEEAVAKFKQHATHPMNPHVKKAWVEGLRSGNYAQTNGHLHLKEALQFTPAGFCCLGVLSELAVENKVGSVVSEPSRSNSNIIEYKSTSEVYSYDSSTAFLIDEVAEWAEFPCGIVNDLMAINDNGGSFELIADLVEEYL